MHFDENMETYVEKSGYKIELLICCFVLVISVLLDQLYGKNIFDLSLSITILLQEYNLVNVSLFSSYFIYFLLFIYPLICYVIRNHIETSLIMLMQTMALIYFESLFKMMYTDSRPIFVSEDIREFSCNCDYGKPSGHALISVALPLLIISDLNSHYRISRNLKIIIIFLYVIGVAIISFSRVYLGENSINQVSIWGGVTGRFILDGFSGFRFLSGSSILKARFRSISSGRLFTRIASGRKRLFFIFFSWCSSPTTC